MGLHSIPFLLLLIFNCPRTSAAILRDVTNDCCTSSPGVDLLGKHGDTPAERRVSVDYN